MELTFEKSVTHYRDELLFINFDISYIRQKKTVRWRQWKADAWLSKYVHTKSEKEKYVVALGEKSYGKWHKGTFWHWDFEIESKLVREAEEFFKRGDYDLWLNEEENLKYAEMLIDKVLDVTGGAHLFPK